MAKSGGTRVGLNAKPGIVKSGTRKTAPYGTKSK